LLSILTLNLTASSQTVTDTNYVRIPTQVARQIALDLVDGDKYKEELTVTQGLLSSTTRSSYMKDTLINNFVSKIELYNKQINLYKETEKIHEQNFKIVNKQNSQLKRNLKITSMSSMIIITVLITSMFLR
jgi:hypothetical protein